MLKRGCVDQKRPWEDIGWFWWWRRWCRERGESSAVDRSVPGRVAWPSTREDGGGIAPSSAETLTLHPSQPQPASQPADSLWGWTLRPWHWLFWTPGLHGIFIRRSYSRATMAVNRVVQQHRATSQIPSARATADLEVDDPFWTFGRVRVGVIETRPGILGIGVSNRQLQY